jgi:hypothetical protein
MADTPLFIEKHGHPADVFSGVGLLRWQGGVQAARVGLDKIESR